MSTLRIGLAAAVLASLPALAPAAPDRDPIAGPLEVFTSVSGGAVQGGAKMMDLAIVNNALDVSLDVVVTHVVIRWADGSVQRLDLGGKRVQLEPGGGLLQFVFAAIPPDAPLGLATFEVRAHVAHVTPAPGPAGGLGHRTWAGDGHAVDSSTFLVVP